MNPLTARYRRLQTQIRAWNRELDRVRDHATQADSSESLAWYNQIEELEHLRREAEDRLEALSGAGERGPSPAGDRTDDPIRRFGRAIAQLSERMR